MKHVHYVVGKMPRPSVDRDNLIIPRGFPEIALYKPLDQYRSVNTVSDAAGSLEKIVMHLFRSVCRRSKHRAHR